MKGTYGWHPDIDEDRQDDRACLSWKWATGLYQITGAAHITLATIAIVPWLISIFPTHGFCALLLGVAFLSYVYRCLLDFTNRTSLTITSEGLKLSHGPLPWPGFNVPSSDIVAIDVHERSTRFNERITPDYDLVVSTSEGSYTLFDKGMPQEGAEFLKSRIEGLLYALQRKANPSN